MGDSSVLALMMLRERVHLLNFSGRCASRFFVKERVDCRPMARDLAVLLEFAVIVVALFGFVVI